MLLGMFVYTYFSVTYYYISEVKFLSQSEMVGVAIEKIQSRKA